MQHVVQHIRAIEDTGWKVPCPIPGMAEAWTGKPLIDFHPKSSAFGPHAKWMNLLHQTTKRYFIMGISLRVWQEGENSLGYPPGKSSERVRCEGLASSSR